MFIPLTLSILAFISGYLIAPVYFVVYRRLKLKSKTLEEEWLHLHHSFYGLLILFIGLVVGYTHISDAYYLIPLGIGLIAHHERTEPGLVGIQKFIYVRRFHRKK